MKNISIQQKHTVPNQHSRLQEELTDQVLLGGLPMRHNRQLHRVYPGQNWFDSLIWLRIPLLLLGIIGALGLLAQYNAWFAGVSRRIYWPDERVSFVFLGIAGCIFVLLLAEWIYVQVIQSILAFQRRKNPSPCNWRSI